MKPGSLMIFGASAGVVGGIASLASASYDATVMIFAAGCLFGKGYAIWEARTALRDGVGE